MAYNRKNKLQLIADIQAVTLEHTSRGATQKWVYDRIVGPQYRISRATYYAYLSIPAQRELKKIIEVESQQLSMFNQELRQTAF